MRKLFVFLLAGVVVLTSLLPSQVWADSSSRTMKNDVLSQLSDRTDAENGYLTLEKLSHMYQVSQLTLLDQLNKGYSLQELQQGLELQKKQKASLDAILHQINPRIEENLQRIQLVTEQKEEAASVTTVTYEQPQGEFVPITGETTILNPSLTDPWGALTSRSVETVSGNVYAKTMQTMASNPPIPTTYDQLAVQRMNIKADTAPYSVGGNESVSTIDGSLQVAQVDMTLPGRNGLSFSLKRKYSSRDAFYYDKHYEPTPVYGVQYYPALTARLYYYPAGVFPVPSQLGGAGDFAFYPFFASYVQYYGDAAWWLYAGNVISTEDFDETVKRELENGIWNWVDADNPSSPAFMENTNVTLHGTRLIARAYTTGRVMEGPGGRTYRMYSAYKNVQKSKEVEENRFPIGKGWSWDLPYMQFKADGKRYLTMFGGSTYELSGTTLKGYPWKDLTISIDSSVRFGGLISYYVLTKLDGEKQYFTSDGKLMQISDAYNNTIRFTYSEVSPYGSVLTGITDAIGNTIQIAYTSTSVTLTQGDRTVTYTKTKDPLQNKELLSQVTDPLGRTTSYVYEMQNAPFDLVGGQYPKDNAVALLKHVYHPTQARTDYLYDPFTRSLGERANETVFRVRSRQDVVTYVSGGESAYNHVDYTYQGDGGRIWRATNTFSTTVNNGRLNTTYTFDKVYIDDNTPEALYNTQIKQDDGTLQVIQDMEYDRENRRSIPVKITTYSKQGGQTSSSQVVTRTYDDYKNLLSETDPNQVTVTYGYDPTTHLLTSSVTPIDEGVNQYVEVERYPTFNSLKAARVKENNSTGKLLAETGYTYDAYGNPVAVTLRDDNRIITVNADYGAAYQYGFPTSQSISVTDANGQPSIITQSYAYNPQTGQMTRYTDGRGYSTEYTYDKLGRMLTLKNPDGTPYTVTYNDSENTVLETDPTNVQILTMWNPLGWKTQTGMVGKSPATYGYDAFGRLAWTEDGAHNRATYAYNAWNQATQVVLPGAGSPTASTAYDVLNRIVTETDPEGYVSKTWRDLLGRTTLVESYSPTGARTGSVRMSYNLAGHVKVQEEGVESEANGISRTQYAYDAMGRLTAVTNALNETTAYTYSMANQLTSIQYPDGNRLLKTYDEMGRLIRRTDPAGSTDAYYYDANSNLVKKTDRMGQSTTYIYDSRNFLNVVQDAMETITYAYDATGRRLSMSDQTGTTSYQYELGSGWLTAMLYPDQRTITYQYDSQGNRIRMTDPFGIVTEYGYDAQNRLERVGSTPGQWDAIYAYRKNSHPSSITRPNGLSTAWGYDTLKTTLTHSRSGQGTLHAYEHQYDIKGNIVERVEDGRAQSFGYDKLSRIQNASEYEETYTYDSRGNRLTLLSGRPLSLKEQSYEYDWKNRLIQTTREGASISYRYNGDGLLTERTEGGQTIRYYYDGADIIAEGSITGSTVSHKASYIRGNQLEARVDASGNKSHYVLNGHGDVVGLVDGAGQMLNSYTYDIWGAPVTTQETISQPFRYSGELWDDNTGLQYLRARWYDPSVGRFINEDTYEGDVTNPLSLNLYTYVLNNPLKYIDPTGHANMVGMMGQDGDPNLTYEGVMLSANGYYTGESSGNYHDFLDYVGLIPVIGDWADGINAVAYLLEGEYAYALLSTGAMVPIVGWAATTSKAVVRTGEAVADAEKILNKASVFKAVCNCFVGGTKVQTDEGEKDIEDIEVGDKLLSKDEETGEVAYKGVTATFNHETDEIYKIHVGGQTIESTFNHPFYVKDKGWTFVKDLNVGDLLVQSDGNALKIDSIKLEKKHVTVYNMTVDEFHTYFVSDLGIWVHNTGPCMNVISSINDKRLIREAEAMGKNQRVQAEADALVARLQQGNVNPGKGNNSLGFGGIHELRGDNGARVYFRNINDGIEIVGKSSKDNQNAVIKVLRDLYDK